MDDEIIHKKQVKRIYPKIRSGSSVYVVIEIHRTRLTMGVVDRQDDVEVRGVFTQLRSAELFVDRMGGLGRKVVIHDATMNPVF